MSDKKEDISGKLKKIILVLSILLAFSVAGLASITVYKHFKGLKAGEVIVTDNIITPEEEAGVLENTKQSPENENMKAENGTTEDALHSASNAQDVNEDSNNNGSAENRQTQVLGENSSSNSAATGSSVDSLQTSSTSGGQGTGGSGRWTSSSTVTESSDAINITLYRRNSGENVLFSMENMFPGDADMRYFRVKVSYKNTVNVRYHAEIRKGYEKLAEVLQTRVRLVGTDEVLYEGSMKDMPEKLNHLLNSTTETTDELCYEILTYLDTSVGNEYMNTETIVDLRWWVEEVENLTSPKTGEYYRMLAIAILAGVSAAGALFFLILRRREEEKDEQK